MEIKSDNSWEQKIEIKNPTANPFGLHLEPEALDFTLYPGDVVEITYKLNLNDKGFTDYSLSTELSANGLLWLHIEANYAIVAAFHNKVQQY